ncbi:MAG TPA: SPFH domain-containing protein [bacterium]|nr:SPFH domain-containing protein [bacterium]
MDSIFLLFVVFAFVVAIISVKKVSQGEVGLIETLGKYTGTVTPGIQFIIPGIQSMRRVDIREQVVNVPEQQIITADNVGVAVDGIVYVQITDPYKAVYEISNVFMAVVNLAQTNLRSVLGTMSLDETLSNREAINARLLASLDKETAKWGIKVMRVEIKRLDPPHDIQEAMSKQMKAEREKRASILEAEGYKMALITKSEGDKQSQILTAEGERESEILRAQGEAQAKILNAEAAAKAIELESKASMEYFHGQAVTKEQLSVVQNALAGNTKFVVDTDILGSLAKMVGNMASK